MAEIEKLIVQLDADIAKFKAGMQQAGLETDKFDAKTKRARLSLDQFKASAVAVGVSVALMGRQVLQASDSYVSMQNQLRVVTDSTEELNEVTERLLKTANETRTGVESTVTLYSRLARSTKDLGLSQNELIEITETINKAFTLSGATAEEASAAIVQLSQGLASGTLRGDEFNSVAEQAPIILDAVSASTGKTRAELRELAAQGKITGEVVVTSLQNYKRAIDTDFAESQSTFSQSLTIANNNFTTFVGKLDEAAGFSEALGRAIVALSENIEGALLAGLGPVGLALLRIRTEAEATINLANKTNTTSLSLNDQIGFVRRNIAQAERELSRLEALPSTNDTTRAEQIASQIDELNNKIALSRQQLEILERQAKGDPIAAFQRPAAAEPEEPKPVVINEDDPSGQKKKTNALQDQIEKQIALFDLQRLSEAEQIQARFELQEAAIKKEVEDKEKANELITELERQKNQQLEELAMTEEERLRDEAKRKIDAQKELFEQEIINEKERADKIKEIREQLEKDIADLDKDGTKDAKLQARNREKNTELGLQVASQLNEAFLEDNKAINAGIIVANTARGVSSELARLNYPGAALQAVLGALQLANNFSATKGGGAISAGGAGGGAPTTTGTAGGVDDLAQLDVDQIDAGGAGQLVRFEFATDSGDDFLDFLAGALNERTRQGRA